MEKFKNTENPVRSTTLEVVKKAKDVKINRARIRDLAEEWAKNDLIVPVWPKDFHLQSDKGKSFHAFEVDWILWNKAQEIKIEKPYHLTKTIFY